MTLPQAHETARNGADRFGTQWKVYRLPAWPAAVYSCKAGELPGEALIIDTYPKVQSVRPAASAPAEPQGSLF